MSALRGALAVALAFHALLACGLPATAIVCITLAFGALALWRAALALSVALAFVATTLLLAFGVRQLSLVDAIYYRPHERLKASDSEYGIHCYLRNAGIEMAASHGDLEAIAGLRIAEPRPIDMRTDEDGFRNDSDYHGQRYLAVGDSFVASVATDQAHTLTAELQRRHGLDVYNLGCPGEPTDYEVYATEFARRKGIAPRILLFLFEGNDFPETLPPASARAAERTWWRRYLRIFSHSDLYRLLFSLRERFEKREEIGDPSQVWVTPTPFGIFGFYVPYIAVSERREAPALPELEAVLARMAPRLEAVFFVPTKVRVFEPWLHGKQPLPHAQWRYLESVCARLGLECADLTPALVKRTAELLPDGGYTYWPDDTHWSPEGVAAAADAVFEVLAKRGGAGEGTSE